MLQPWRARAAGFHPYSVKDVSALPEGLREAAQAALPPGVPVLHIFGVPADYRSRGLWGFRRTPEQAIVFTQDGALVVQGGSEGAAAPPAVYIRHEDLLYARSSLLLLQGRLELAAAVDDELTRPAVEFNTVGWPLLECELRAFLCHAGGMPQPGREVGRRQEEDPIERLSLPFKFASGLRYYGLLPGDTLAGAVFQSGIWAQSLGVVRRQIAPNTLLALTGAFLILIEERRALHRTSREYGWIITHVPRSAVVDVEVGAQGLLHELKICMARGGATAERRVILDSRTAGLWRELWAGHAAKERPDLLPVPA